MSASSDNSGIVGKRLGLRANYFISRVIKVNLVLANSIVSGRDYQWLIRKRKEQGKTPFLSFNFYCP